MNDAQVAVFVITLVMAFYIGQCVIIGITRIYDHR